MKARRLEIRLKLVGPVLTHATATGAPGVDSPFLQTPDGRFALPMSLLKGRLSQAWDELHAADSTFAPDVAGLMGSQCPEGSSNAPERGRLEFNGFLVATKNDSSVRHRIAIDHERGSVAHGALQVIEAPFAAGEIVEFVGHVPFHAKTDEEAMEIAGQVRTGLQWVSAFGALKGSGFGRLAGVAVAVSDASASVVVDGVGELGSVIDVELLIHEPFCVSVNQPNRNLHRSGVIIPGGVLKGALASTWRAGLGLSPSGEVNETTDPARRELGRAFEAMRMLHAFPCPPGAERPGALPRSLVVAHDQVADVALASSPLLARVGNELRPPAFGPDWKPKERRMAEAFMGHVSPPTYARTRSKHDRRKRRAEDEKLFSHELIVPDGYVWKTRILLPSGAAASTAQQLADILSGGLHFIGKTKATATVRLSPSAWAADEGLMKGRIQPFDLAAQSRHPVPRDARKVWTVMLQSPALILDPRPLQMRSDGQSLRGAYEAAWRGFSNGALELCWYYASHAMAGGNYLHQRFKGGQQRYAPYLLTEAGSVFVFAPSEGKDAPAREVLARWSRDGLELPSWLHEHEGGRADWRTCPYVPQNGFGEVEVNHGVHVRPVEGFTFEGVNP